MMPVIDLLSLGAGTQSSWLLHLAATGQIGPKPVAAVFADTGREPRTVYRWLDFLEQEVANGIPIVRVSVGDLAMAATTLRVSRSGKAYLRPALPVFYRNPDGSKGRGLRHCTKEFKIVPIQRFARSIRGTQRVRMWLGITTDEAWRVSQSQEDWLDHHYPLLEAGLSRTDCEEGFVKLGWPRPPKSACKECPFRSDAQWIRLRDDEPLEFQEAVAFERQLQAATLQTPMDGVPFLHDSLVPLDRAQFVAGEHEKQFINDCKGMCGV